MVASREKNAYADHQDQANDTNPHRVGQLDDRFEHLVLSGIEVLREPEVGI